MNHFYLRPEDLPPRKPVDASLQRRLDQAVTSYFYETCDYLTQGVLSRGGWYLTTCGTALTLVVVCVNRRHNWDVLKYMASLGKYLREFAPIANIRIYPPPGDGTSLEMRFQLPVVSQS
ncbi:hypothetical protein [Crocosphaera sp. Alani8]|uniref:hypothetical protein n=1 Tax=Crocosphaera sp. Alani8 TaxID=3038952 RepID=UPI00313F12C7